MTWDMKGKKSHMVQKGEQIYHRSESAVYIHRRTDTDRKHRCTATQRHRHTQMYTHTDSHAQVHTASKIYFLDGTDREVFSQFMAAWELPSLPLPATPELILAFPTWGSSSNSKPGCQTARTGLSSIQSPDWEDKYPWSYKEHPQGASTRKKSPLLTLLLCPCSIHCPFLLQPSPALLLPKTCRGHGHEGEWGAGRSCCCVCRDACSSQEGQGSQPPEDLTRSVTSGSHQHCLFLSYSACGCFLV